MSLILFFCLTTDMSATCLKVISCMLLLLLLTSTSLSIFVEYINHNNNNDNQKNNKKINLLTLNYDRKSNQIKKKKLLSLLINISTYVHVYIHTTYNI